MEQNALETFLTGLFGQGQSEVTVRKPFQACIPSLMTNDAIVEAWQIPMHSPATFDTGMLRIIFFLALT